MIELIVGLVALLALFAGMLQLVSLSVAHTDTLAKAREEAGDRAMSTVPVASGAEHIRYWEEGPDTRRYSVDDTHSLGNSAAFISTVVDPAASNAAAWLMIRQAPRNAIRALHDSALPISQFGLVDGTESATVQILPAVRHLIYDADTITIESKVWMPWMREIY